MRPKTPTPQPAPQPNYKQTFDQFNNQISGEVNKYVDELIGFAKADYDFAAKWIENNYKVAVGSDDRATADFLKKVANTLEEKVGRIAFDYETGSYRVNQDADRGTALTIRNRDMALSRLAEDEQTYKANFDRDLAQGRDQQNASLNQRGILSSTREGATGLAGKEIGMFEQGASDTLSAYERVLGRNRQDIQTASADQLFDIGLNRTRSLEDLTTGARRGVIDERNQRDYNMESAKRQMEQRKLQAEQERRKLLNQAPSYADYLTRGATGL